MDSIIDRSDKQRSNQNGNFGVSYSYQFNLQPSESMAKQKL